MVDLLLYDYLLTLHGACSKLGSGLFRTHSVPLMDKNLPTKRKNEDLIKVLVPSDLKQDLLGLAASRNISLSALLRLIVSEYIKLRR